MEENFWGRFLGEMIEEIFGKWQKGQVYDNKRNTGADAAVGCFI